MKIKNYIKELLFTNQGVVIPGLGGFVSDYEPAEFDVNENKFLPPSKKISFNTDYAYQDNLLTEFISKK
ncbi:MAG: SPOR domain-containing protein, partial [Marinilabiliales bacterium]